MVKEIHTSTLRLFERIVGPTRTSLAEKKARLIFATPDPSLKRPANTWPLTYRLPDDVEPLSGRPVVNHAGVFCADRLDIGTRFFLQHPAGRRRRPSGGGPGLRQRCGRQRWRWPTPAAEVLFTDESFAGRGLGGGDVPGERGGGTGRVPGR